MLLGNGGGDQLVDCASPRRGLGPRLRSHEGWKGERTQGPGPPFFRIDVAAVDHRPGPVGLVCRVQLGQQDPMQIIEHPVLIHRLIRRRHVMSDLKPSPCGTSSQPIPVCSTYKMPCRHCRSGTGRGPGVFIGPRRKQRLEKLPQLIIQQSA